MTTTTELERERLPRMLWFSIDVGEGRLEYELPSDERWFTRQDWMRYNFLNDLATAHCMAITVLGCPYDKRG